MTTPTASKAVDDQRLVVRCSFRSRWPSWVCVNWLTITWTWAMRRGGRTRATRSLTLVASALAGGDCRHADVLSTGGTAQTLGCVVKAPSTLGTFLRSFRWGHSAN